jgi:hypothetical protein
MVPVKIYCLPWCDTMECCKCLLTCHRTCGWEQYIPSKHLRDCSAVIMFLCNSCCDVLSLWFLLNYSCWHYVFITLQVETCFGGHRPALWSSGPCSWLQIQRSRFDSQLYQIFWEVVALEQGPLSLVRIIEEIFEGNSGSSLENRN